LSFDRLLLVATGGLTVSLLPTWAVWLREHHPDLTVRLVLTRTAERMVSRTALAALVPGGVDEDVWVDGRPTALHVELAQYAEAVAVFPATLHTVARLALGLADTPAMLALQITTATIGIAPAFPPGAQHNPIVTGHLDTLAARPNVVVAPLRPAPSAATGRADATGNGSLPELLSLIEDHRRLDSPQAAP